MALPELIRKTAERPGMYLPAVEFDVAVAYLQGINLASAGGLLDGFREWLVVEVGYGNNLVWWALALILTFPEAESPRDSLKNAGMQKHAVDSLFGLLARFVEERDAPRGMFRILLRHQRWLESQDWYGTSSPDYFREEADHPGGQPNRKRRPDGVSE